MVFFYILLPESCASSLTKDFLSNVHASGNFLRNETKKIKIFLGILKFMHI